MSRRKLLGGLGALVAVSALGARAAHGMSRRLRVVRRTVELPGWPRLRIVHLTDVHLGLGTPGSVVRDALEETRRAAPDLVALTGDYVNLSLHRLDRLGRLASELPRPAVAVLGNHDHWSGAEQVARVLEEAGVEVLRNRSARLALAGGALTVVGVDDGFSGHDDPDRALAGVEEPARVLALTHYPLTAEALAARGVGLVLAGHTHGAFAKAPRMTAVASRFPSGRYLHGLYLVGDTTLHVGAGLGSVVAGSRGGSQAPPEVAVLDVAGSAASAARPLPVALERA